MATMLAALAFTACEKDGNMLTIAGLNDTTLSGDGDEIVLKYENEKDLALTVYWTDNGQITLSNPQVEAPKNAFENTIQFSGTKDFTDPLEIALDKGELYRQFTVAELNGAVTRLGFTPNEKQPLYVRIASSLSKNMETRYSNVITVYVTPYKLDLYYGNVLASDWSDTGRTLYSPTENGVYSGFLGVNAWYNWFLREANGVAWGNVGNDGGGKPFVTSSNNQKWNFWFPGQSGCYYTIVDTKKMEWSALLLTSLNISGDLNGAMTYSQKTNQWLYTFKATPGTLNVTLSGVGKQYNVATGTDDEQAVDTPFGFSSDGEQITFGQEGKTIAVPVEISGDATLTLDLSDPSDFKLSVIKGGPDIPTVKPYLYIPGIDDGISGEWTFNNYLTLYNEEQKSYGGACDVNSLWGYYFTPEAAWVTGYGFDEGDAYSGKLLNENKNIPAPDPGKYVMDVSLSGMTYKLTAIQSVSYAGLNDDWTLRPMTCTEGCIYEATVTKSANTPWGVKIIINEDWNIYFGGGKGKLLLYAEGFDGDNDLPNGEYTLRIDLAKGTYEYVSQSVNPYLYMPGIDDGISGEWTFNNYLTLYNDAQQCYGGACDVNSLWGYYFTPEAAWVTGYG
ncbi:MAG: DUF5114 domain-containing protein, partial [Bacteroidaceae bacterium]|nr:DUF5114 domain-containing protein [Bacteroidaceae bacterium]